MNNMEEVLICKNLFFINLLYMVCTNGKIKRNSYRRKSYVKSDGTYVSSSFVPSSCVKSTSRKHPGRKSYAYEKILPKPKKEALGQFGYSTKLSASERHASLRKASKKLGMLETLRSVNLRRNFLKGTPAGKIMSSDVKFMSNLYKEKKN